MLSVDGKSERETEVLRGSLHKKKLSDCEFPTKMLTYLCELLAQYSDMIKTDHDTLRLEEVISSDPSRFLRL